MRKKWLVISGVFAACVAISVIATSYLSGGFGNLAKNLKSMPNPKSEAIARPREKVITEISGEFATLEQKTGLSNFGSEFLDECYEGQNNWKVHQGFAHRCSYRITRYYGFNNDFKMQMTNFLNSLFSIGWNTNTNYNSDSIAMTYDYYRNVPSGSAPNPFLNGGMPAKKEALEMDINYQDARYLRNSLYDSQSIMLRAGYSKTYVNKQLLNVDTIVDTIAKNNQYLLVIKIEKDYFQN